MSGQNTALLRFSIDVNAKPGADEFTRRMRDANRRVADEAAKLQKEALKQAEQAQAQSAKRMEELVERRRRLAIEGIKDEATRRRATIEAEYQEERRRIRMLLAERLKANEISERKMKQQLTQFEGALRTVRDRRIADVPGEVMTSKSDRLMDALGLGHISARGSAMGLSGRAAMLAGGAAVGGLAIGAGFAKAIGDAAAFEAQMAEVGRTTGLTGESLQGLGADLLDLSARLGAPQTEMAEIAKTAGSLDIKGRENIAAFTETVFKFASATDMAAGEAADALGKVSNAFALPASEAHRLGSAVDQLADTTAAEAPDIIKGLREVGTAGRQAGLSAPQIAAMVATLVDAGIEAPTAGNAMKNVLTRMVTEGEKVGKVAGMTRQAWVDAFTKDPLTALQTYLGKLREMPPALQTIHVKDAFGDENILSVTTLATQTDRLTEALASSQQAYADGTRLNASFATSQDTLSAQWNVFTANVTKLATEFGGTFVPALKDALSGVNDLIGGSTRAAENLAVLNAEASNVRDLEALAKRYTELASKQNLTSEETEELRKLTQRLAEQFPAVFAAYDGATSKAGAYTSELWRQVAALRARNAEEMAAGRKSAFEGFQRGLGDEQYGRRLATTGAYRATNTNAGGTAMPQVDRVAGAAAISAGRQKQLEAVRQLEAAGIDFSTGPITSVMRVVEAAKAARASLTMDEANALARLGFEQAQRRAAAAPAPKPEEERPTGTLPPERTPRTRNTDAAERRAEEAGKRLSESLAQARAEAITSELEREEAIITARYDRERSQIRETAAEAAKAKGANKTQIQADADAAVRALDVAQARDLERAREAAREAAFQEREAQAQLQDDRARMAGTTDDVILTGRLARLEAELAKEAEGSERRKRLVLDVERARLASDQAAKARREQLATMDREAISAQKDAEIEALTDAQATALLAIKDERAREQTAILFRKNARIAAAEEAARRERAEVEATVQDAEVKRRRLAAIEQQLVNETADATRDAARETAEYQMAIEKARLAQYEQLARNVLDVIEASFGRRERMSEAEKREEMRGLDEQEKALRESLRTREITAEVFADRMAMLAEQRADTEKQQAEESAGVQTRLMLGLVGVAREVALEVIKAELAKAAASALRSLFDERWPLPLKLALAGGTIAAVFAAEAGIRKAAGFQIGGLTGPGRDDEVAGFVHRNEMVLEAPLVRGQEKEWLEIRRLAQQGVTPAAMLASVRAAQRPALPSAASLPGGAADTRLALGLDGLRRDVQALARRPLSVSTRVILTDADARRQLYAAQREEARRQPMPRS